MTQRNFTKQKKAGIVDSLWLPRKRNSGGGMDWEFEISR